MGGQPIAVEEQYADLFAVRVLTNLAAAQISSVELEHVLSGETLPVSLVGGEGFISLSAGEYRLSADILGVRRYANDGEVFIIDVENTSIRAEFMALLSLPEQLSLRAGDYAEIPLSYALRAPSALSLSVDDPSILKVWTDESCRTLTVHGLANGETTIRVWDGIREQTVQVAADSYGLYSPQSAYTLSMGEEFYLSLLDWEDKPAQAEVTIFPDTMRTQFTDQGLHLMPEKPGEYVLSAQAFGNSVDISITVLDAFRKEPVLPRELFSGTTQNIELSTYSGADRSVSASSSRPDVVEISVKDNKIVIVPRASGKTTLTVTLGAKTISREARVMPVVLGVTVPSYEVTEGETFTFDVRQSDGIDPAFEVQLSSGRLLEPSREDSTFTYTAQADLADDIIITVIEKGRDKRIERTVKVQEMWRISINKPKSEEENNLLIEALLRDTRLNLRMKPSGVITQAAQQAMLQAKKLHPGMDTSTDYLTREEYDVIINYTPPAATGTPLPLKPPERHGNAVIADGTALGDTLYLLDNEGRLIIYSVSRGEAMQEVEGAEFKKIVSNSEMVVALSDDGVLYPFGDESVTRLWFNSVTEGMADIDNVYLPIEDVALSERRIIYSFAEPGEITSKSIAVEESNAAYHQRRASDKGEIKPAVIKIGSGNAVVLELISGSQESMLVCEDPKKEALVLYGTTDKNPKPQMIKTDGLPEFDPARVFINKNVVAILNQSGDMYVRGDNGSSQLGNGTLKKTAKFIAPLLTEGVPLTGVKDIVLCDTYTLALLEDGGLVIMGTSGDGRVYDYATATGISAVAGISRLSSNDVLLVNERGEIAVLKDGNVEQTIVFQPVRYPE